MSSRSIKNCADTDLVAEHFRRSCETLSYAADDPKVQAAVHGIAETITAALRSGHKLLIAGNGGSAADAQHIAGEFLSRLNFDRNPLPAVALTTDSSVLTAIGNDYGFERTFERQVRGLGQPGDVFIAISTSGRSPNVIAAVKAARETGLTTVGFTGIPGNSTMQPLCDHCLAAPCGETPSFNRSILSQRMPFVAWSNVTCSRPAKMISTLPIKTTDAAAGQISAFA